MIEKVIYVGGVARSGTSWVGQIFNSSPSVRFRFQPMFSYEFRNKIDEDSTSVEYQSFFSDLFYSKNDFLIQKDKIDSGIYPNFYKTEDKILVFKENRFQSFIEPMLRKCSNLKFLGIIRNPSATLFSWSQNEKEFPPGSDIYKEWRFANCKNKGNEDYFGYFKWKEVANLYLDLEAKHSEKVKIIHYDKFIEDPVKYSKELFKFFKIPFTQQTLNFLNESQKRADQSYYSVFKGRSNKEKWKTELPHHIIEQIEYDLKGTRLEQFLY